MINTQTQIDSLIDLAVLQRTELKQLVDSLPQLRDHLSAEIERNLEEIEPAIRSELEQFVAARALDTQAKTSAELSAKLDAMARNLESTTAAKYSVLMAERAENANLLAKAEARIEDAASMLSHAVKEIVTDELSRFPRAGEIDQLRKEFTEPRGLNPRGRWTPDETYQRLDLVTINGDSFVSNIDGNRERPSRTAGDWTLSAARGNGGGGGGATTLTDLVAVPANGQILIGNGSGFVNSTLTAGENITITNGPGSITIAAAGGSLAAFEDGTEAAPSIAFINELSTGLYRPAADTVGIVGGGHDIVRLTDVASATDYLEIKNAIGVSTPLHVLASGPSTNIGMHLQPKGSGLLTISDGTDFNKGIRFRSSSSAASAITLLDAVSTAGRVITLPDATDTLVGKATTDTLTNKTLTSPTLTTPISATLTAPAATNLTLAGGSSGASLVLGQGAAAGSATITPTGTGVVAIAGTGSKLTVAGTTAATSSITGSGIFGGGIGVAGSVVAGGTNNGTNEYSYPFLSSATTLGGFATYSSGATVNQRIWAIQHGSATGDGVWRLRALNDALSSGSNAISITRTAEAIGTISLGTTTAIVSVLGTTAGASNAGALVVAGGISAGQSAQASWFGGNITVGTGAAAVASVLNRGTTAQSALAQWQTASAANWSVGSGATGTNTNLEFYNHNTSSSNLTLNYNTGAATFAGAVTATSLTLSTTPLAFASGGTGATTAGSALAKITPIATTVTSATAVTLTNTSANYQIFTGSTTQTILLPVTSTLETGWTFSLCNNSTATLVVQTSNGTTLFAAVPVGTTLFVKCIATGSTAITDWEANITEFSTNSGTGSVVLNSNPTFSAFSNTGTAAMTGAAASAHTLGTNLTTGTVIIGGTATTGTLTFGQSTAGNTINIDAGATASGATKTLNIGTGGLAGSTTAITIGSATGTSTTEIKGDLKIGNAYVGTPVVSTGYITIQDSLGTTYKVAVSL